MRYDENDKRIKLDARELVSLARRKISSVLPYDENEPKFEFVPKKILMSQTEGASNERLYHSFSFSGYDFELLCRPDGVRDFEVITVRQTELRRGSVPPELRAQTEGEAYITAYVLAERHALSEVKLHTVYVDKRTGVMQDAYETVKKEKLDKFFARCSMALSEYARPEIERITERLPSMKRLGFPYGKPREGQSALVKAVYRTIAKGARLFASAPTGTGKTVSVLYPAVRALGDLRCDKVFYLTPKTTTGEVARECIELMCERGADIRAIILSAKERSCQRENVCRRGKKYCENSKCNKLHDAVMSLYSLKKCVVSLSDILPVAERYTVCPYELELAYSELCDIVICDFNYLFEPNVYIRRFFEEGGNYAFLIDEAHNLPDRAREMYSAEISYEELLAPEGAVVLGDKSRLKATIRAAAHEFRELFYPYLKEELRRGEGGEYVGAHHMSELPAKVYTVFESLISLAEDELNENLSAKDDLKDERLAFLRDYLARLKKVDSAFSRFDESYELFLFYDGGNIRMKVFCLDTGGAVAERLDKGGSAVFFSATLVPIEYYRAVLGGERTSEVLDVRSPFDPSQLSVSVIDKISTRYSEREDSLAAVCRTIAATISAKRGNYMIFSPSFEYSDALFKAFSEKYPKLNVISQKRNMSAKEKGEFLDKFREESEAYLVAFCVMGGIYSEGIDLAGDSLIGAVVVGIGMPALSYEREAMSAYYQDRFEMGKEYAYIYPGMNRVLQAAGRVIRRESDKGVIVLIDDRFADPIYKKSVPAFWRGMKYIPDAKTLKKNLEDFWNNKEK